MKRQADPVKELNNFERSVLAGVVNAHFEETKQTLCDGLRGSTSEYVGCRFADHLSVGSVRLSVKDAVFHGEDLGIIEALAEEDGSLYAVVRVCSLRSQASFPN